MSARLTTQVPPARRNGRLAPLENGACLTAPEFLRRYETRPEVKKAKLIEGIVYMPSPARADARSEPNSLVQTWLGTYAAPTPGVKAQTNYQLLSPDRQRHLHSLTFPGLVLNVPALLAHDGAAVLATLDKALKQPVQRAFVAKLAAGRSTARKWWGGAGDLTRVLRIKC